MQGMFLKLRCEGKGKERRITHSFCRQHACIHAYSVCLCMFTCGFDYVSSCVFCMEINNNIMTQGSLLSRGLSIVFVFKNRSHVSKWWVNFSSLLRGTQLKWAPLSSPPYFLHLHHNYSGADLKDGPLNVALVVKTCFQLFSQTVVARLAQALLT